MTAKPGPILAACIAYVTDRGSLPKRGTWTYSLNFKMLGLLTGVLRGHAEDARALAGILRDQLDGRSGLYGDEAGGGYAPIQTAIVLCVIRHARNGESVPGELLEIARRWYGAALRMAALTAVPHRDSVLGIGPASRLRSPVADGLSLPLTETIGAPARRFGIGRGSKPDAVVWEWKSADDQAADLRRLMGVEPSALAAECGVGDLFLRGVVEGRAANSLLAARGLRSLHPLRIRRYRSGDLAAWWPSFTSHDAPHAGATSVGGELHTLQPQPIGPRAYNPSNPKAPWDHQWWCGENVQSAWIDGGELVAEFHGAPGRSRSGDEGDPVQRQTQRVPLPPGDVVLDLLIDLDGAREVQGEQPAPAPKPPPGQPAPAPPSPPLPGTPQPEPPRGGEDEPVATRGQGREILAYLDSMIEGTAGRGASGELRRRLVDAFKL